MRLIDSDKIKGCAKYIKTNENFEPYIIIVDLAKLLDEQPTSYDIDKVVDEMQSEVEIWEDSGKEYNDKCEIAVARGMRNAIEIVKQGCVIDERRRIKLLSS